MHTPLSFDLMTYDLRLGEFELNNPKTEGNNDLIITLIICINYASFHLRETLLDNDALIIA